MNTSVKSLAAAVGFVARSVTGTSRFAAYQRNSPRSCIGHQRLQQQLQTNNFSSGAPTWHGTTILCVRKGDKVCLMGDGQVSMGSVVVKPNTRKIRRILPKNSASNIRGAPSEETNPQGTLVGFAGSTADAFTLLERLEGKLDEYPGQLTRSCVELAKGWRTDKYLRRLEASIIVADKNVTLELTGNGDVLESHDGVIAVGSGGHFALAAARALMDQPLGAEEIAKKAMDIASEMCVYTNNNYIIENIDIDPEEDSTDDSASSTDEKVN